MTVTLFFNILMESNKDLDGVIDVILKYFKKNDELIKLYGGPGRVNYVCTCNACWDIIKIDDDNMVILNKDHGPNFDDIKKMHDLFLELIKKFGRKKLVAISICWEDPEASSDDLPVASFVKDKAMLLTGKVGFYLDKSITEAAKKIKVPANFNSKLKAVLKSKNAEIVDLMHGFAYWLDIKTGSISISEIESFK
jgi:hypothetical protein